MPLDRATYLRRLIITISTRKNWASEMDRQHDIYLMDRAKEELRDLRADDFNEVETDG